MNIIKLEDINDKLYKGIYGDIEGIFLKENNYIHISKLCKYGLSKNNKVKEFKNWLMNDNSKELIKEINEHLTSLYMMEPVVEIPALDANNSPSCIINVTSFSIEYRGYYVHKLLAIQVAQWISPSFALRISRMYDDYARRKYESEIKEKDNNIIDLKVIIEEMRIKHTETKVENKNIRMQLDSIDIRLMDQNTELEETNNKLEEVKESNINTNNKLTHLSNGIKSLNINGIKDLSLVYPLTEKKIEILVLIKVLFENNDTLFIVNRCQRIAYIQLRDRIINNYCYEKKTKKRLIKVQYLSNSNNAVSSWNSLKTYYNKVHFICDGNKIYFHTHHYKIDNLVEELIRKSKEIKRPIEELEKEYNELVNDV